MFGTAEAAHEDVPTQWLAAGSEAVDGRFGGTMPDFLDWSRPYRRHSATYARSDAHEERRRANSEDLYITIPRGPISSVINKVDSSVNTVLVVVVLRFVYHMSNCSVRNRLTIDNK